MKNIPQRASRTVDYELEEDEVYYTQRPHASIMRYTQPRQQVIQRGNKRIIIHHEQPPKSRLHWSVFLGLGMILALLLWFGAGETIAWWNNHQLDSQYGMPRTYQTDAVVYPSDTSDHPSHYIFLNLNDSVTIIELPHDDPTHAKIYKGPTLYSDNAGYTPVTGEFKQVNDGTQFKPQQ